MSRVIPFHIQQNTDLEVVRHTLALGVVGEIDAFELASRIGVGEDSVRSRIRAPLGQMGLLDGWNLAVFGRRLARIREERDELLGEAMHLRLYALHWRWPEIRFSFAYAIVCDWLWDRGICRLDSEGVGADIAGAVPRRAGEFYGTDPAAIAFSESSVRGALHWLDGLEPPVKQSEMFCRRHAAPYFSVLWAVSALYVRRGVAPGTRLTLDPEAEDSLCRALLLEPDALPRALEMTQRAYDFRREHGLFGVGTEGGFGRWLLLVRPMPVGALEPGEDDEAAESGDSPDDASDAWLDDGE